MNTQSITEAINDISYNIRGAAFKVHTELGPGLLESVYETVLAHELRKRELTVLRQVSLPVIYDGICLDEGFRQGAEGDLILHTVTQT